MKKAASSVKTPAQTFRSTFTFFISLVAGIFVFMLAAIVIGQFRGALMPTLNKHHQLLTIIMAVVSFACLLGAKKSFAIERGIAKNSLNPLPEKLNMYSGALVKYMVICDAPVMLGIILFLLTANFVFLAFAAVFLGLMLTMMPTKKKVAEQLELNAQEESELG